jgi:hypothetical protein
MNHLQTKCLPRSAIAGLALCAFCGEFVCMREKSPVGHPVCFVKNRISKHCLFSFIFCDWN